MTRGVFVTGTDTGVGKTVVACALVSALRGRAIDVGVMKPCETGVGPDGPLDALALGCAAGNPDPLDLVCPERFALPAAPNVAAAHEGRSFDPDSVQEAFRTLASRHAFMVVEGAGGLLVPTRPPDTMADLAATFGLPVLVVTRTSLGAINHTLLTLAEVQRRSLRLAGVVASHSGGQLSTADESNFAHLREVLGDLLVGEIPFLADGGPPPMGSISLDRILARCDIAA